MDLLYFRIISGTSPPYNYWLYKNDIIPVDSGVITIYNVIQTQPPGGGLHGLGAGKYSMVLRDINGCTPATKVEYINQPLPVNFNFGKTTYDGGFHITCKGYSDGHLWAESVTGGNGTYTYNWFTFDGLITGPNNTNRLDNIPAGTYYLTVSDFKGCQVTKSFEIVEPEGIDLVSSTKSLSNDGNYNISCFGGNDGSITLDFGGGSGNYTYLWTGPPASGLIPTQEDQTNLIAGNYNIYIRDLNGCDRNYPFTLTEPDSLSLGILKTQTPDLLFNIDCNGGTGGIDITVGGGSVGNYTYTWSTIDGSGILPGAEDQPLLTSWNIYCFN